MIAGMRDSGGMASVADVYDGVARVAQALANGTRLKILELLTQRERGVQELAELADLNVTTTSAHLQVLREAGLVVARRAGRYVHYRIGGDDVAALLVDIARVAEARRPAVRSDIAAALPEEGLRLMGRDELIAAARSGDGVVLDVRPADEYEAGHLHGAVSIPIDELVDRLDEIPRDAEVVAYCRGRFCVLSHEAVRGLTAHGRSARVAQGGIVELVAAGVALAGRETGGTPGPG